jgi:hypothetical protein
MQGFQPESITKELDKVLPASPNAKKDKSVYMLYSKLSALVERHSQFDLVPVRIITIVRAQSFKQSVNLFDKFLVPIIIMIDILTMEGINLQVTSIPKHLLINFKLENIWNMPARSKLVIMCLLDNGDCGLSECDIYKILGYPERSHNHCFYFKNF